MWRFAVNLDYPLKLAFSFTVDPAHDSVVALVGPNGAGKSTLLRALAGFFGPEQGGLDGPPWKRPLAWVPQQPSLLPHRTVRAQIEWVLGGPAGPELMEWAGRLGVAALWDLMPHQLSGGEQQRASLLRALAARPRILALDEALSQIDAPSRESILAALQSWAAADDGRAILVTTHQFADVAHLADRVLIMDQGRLLRDGAPSEVMLNPKTWEAAALVGYVSRVKVHQGAMALLPTDVAWEAPGVPVPAAAVGRSEAAWTVEIEVLEGRRRFLMPVPPDGVLGSQVYLRGSSVEEERE